jgi:hypothetical protein
VWRATTGIQLRRERSRNTGMCIEEQNEYEGGRSRDAKGERVELSVKEKRQGTFPLKNLIT